MAGDWMKFDKATPDKPEVFAIADSLCIDPDAVVGKLMRVWSWFDTHTESGNALNVTPALLDRIAGVTGFVSAMEKAGWMTIKDGDCFLPNFDRHCGQTAKKRAQNNKRISDFRARNAESVTDACTKEELSREEEKHFCASPEGDAPILNSEAVPYQAIVDGYNTTLTNLPKVRELTAKRRTAIRMAWQESAHRRNPEFWASFWEECADDPFLNGTGPYLGEHSNWRPGFDFLIRSSTITKVYEKAMHRMEAST